MAKSRDTFNKKEKEKLKQKKKQEKQDRKDARKSGEKSSDFEDMIAYVDEYGNIVDTPPDPTKKRTEIDVDSIEIGVPKYAASEDDNASVRKGKVTFFNESKGYGFIKDEQTQESIFVHINGCVDKIKENDKVNFETEKTPKGLSAVSVKLA
ncbi:cold-shock protein [Belliella kenyensis]|uniref:Cold-shock protein n=1 Tax=Belliella kenyensis TaxID=1472724 RepID=A0ABV8EJQ1_9BACT|nr:cold shock domain-containing protein [Belliella kenyensis]MCH7400408.1 cold shock domain-containing protein [Belliella kenyensis]MDN3604575.1 cold shock domain-containing protein [Belliella kenyensis]